MSDARFEGKDLPELLALLHGPAEPAPISFVPQTIGWLILSIWLAVCALLLALAYGRARRANRYRREALSALDALARDRSSSPSVRGTQLATLIRRTALAAYPRALVAPLTGDAWAAFLCHSSGNDPIVTAAAPDLAAVAYRPDGDPDALLEPARRWVEKHRA